ncbi:MAG: hypothetical protein QGG90_04175 [Nitrospinota bacterium]|nr:hypothetical protein [Nitrospinota bacterium]
MRQRRYDERNEPNRSLGAACKRPVRQNVVMSATGLNRSLAGAQAPI